MPAAGRDQPRGAPGPRHPREGAGALQRGEPRGCVHRAPARERGAGMKALVASATRRLGVWDVWPILCKELLQLRRDRLTFAMMTGIPAIQLVMFGYAIQTDVRHLPMVVLDQSATEESRALVTRMVNTGNFDLVGAVADRDRLRDAIESGRARAALVIPPEYARVLKRART